MGLSGNSCKFFIGDFTIKYIKPSELFDGVYILENNGVIASILQTADIDGNPKNGIKLSKKLSKCITNPIKQTDLNKLHKCLKVNDDRYKGNIVSIDDALTHLKETIEENSPSAKNINVITNEDMPVDIALKAYDKQNDKLRYKITLYQKNGKLITSGLYVRYLPNSEFVGNDSFRYSATDGTFTSKEATVSIRAIDTHNIHIKEPYSIIKIDTKNFKRKIFLDSSADSLYLVLSNSSKKLLN